MRIGELAGLAQVSRDTLRHYERVGVLPPATRGPNGYRVYSPAALDRVRLVRRALALGFRLSDLATALRARDAGETPCRAVRQLAARKLESVEHEMAALADRRHALRKTLRDWDRRLAHTQRGRQARLLDHVSVPKQT